MSTPILVQPNQEAPFRLETDTLGYATGAVLSQLSEDGKWHPVGFMSKGLYLAKRNYVIHNKELLSVIHGLEEWRHILEGTRHILNIFKFFKFFKFFLNPCLLSVGAEPYVRHYMHCSN